MINVNNYWFIDGLCTFQTFSLVIEKGATRFLEIPPKKEGIIHDWEDIDGIDADLSHIFFAHREVPLQCAIIAPDEATFIQKRDLLMNQFKKPGLRRLNFKATGQRSFYVYYKTSTGWEAVASKTLRGDPAPGQKFYRFTMVFVETNPSAGGSEDVFIITEGGRYIIT